MDEDEAIGAAVVIEDVHDSPAGASLTRLEAHLERMLSEHPETEGTTLVFEVRMPAKMARALKDALRLARSVGGTVQ